ncbi:hypothetical protein Ciccas_008782 [Cichlidogyrus casuarinus]|uniref:Uncharacterized protein n=1 Tax=Cichlidogyrus casuarinus TaxID=1844966 RepID=A0ABD2Q1M6_9PLAT
MPKNCKNCKDHSNESKAEQSPVNGKNEEVKGESKDEETPVVSKDKETPVESKKKKVKFESKDEQTPIAVNNKKAKVVSKDEETPVESKNEEAKVESKDNEDPARKKTPQYFLELCSLAQYLVALIPSKKQQSHSTEILISLNSYDSNEVLQLKLLESVYGINFNGNNYEVIYQNLIEKCSAVFCAAAMRGNMPPLASILTMSKAADDLQQQIHLKMKLQGVEFYDVVEEEHNVSMTQLKFFLRHNMYHSAIAIYEGYAATCFRDLYEALEKENFERLPLCQVRFTRLTIV